MRRTFRHEAEGRTWWIEVHESTLRIGFSEDSDPSDEVVRERRASTPKAAQDELAALIREQLAEGFVELNVAPTEDADAFYARLQQTWKSAAAHVPSELWLEQIRALSPALRERFHREWLSANERGLAWPEANARKAWLRMQVEITAAPFLLGLRDAHEQLALEALERAPMSTPHLEAALLAMIESLPASRFHGHAPSPGCTNVMARFPFSPASVSHLASLAHSRDANQATNAAFVLARYPHLSRRDVLEALQAWLQLGDALRPLAHAEMLLAHAIPELGMALHRDAKRPQTREELARLLQRALTTAR